MDRKKEFIKIFNLLEKKYKKDKKRLAGEGWDEPWQVVVATIMSAQSKDELTIVIAENLFSKYKTLESLALAKENDVLKIFKSLNYNKTKAKHVVAFANILLSQYFGVVPNTIDELIKLPGVGRKTANLVITEVYNLPGICVDTHVHRLCNVFGIVKTKTPDQTEVELKKLLPKKYWNKINRYFVLWGKEVSGYDKEKLLNHILN
ncbi:MAG: endonuclease III domain-containing protein [Candidatus Woesearchaeota archaeon]